MLLYRSTLILPSVKCMLALFMFPSATKLLHGLQDLERAYVIIFMRVTTHRGWAHQQRVSTFLTRKNSHKFFRVLLMGFEPQVFRSWVWRSTNWATPSPRYHHHHHHINTCLLHSKTHILSLLFSTTSFAGPPMSRDLTRWKPKLVTQLKQMMLINWLL